MFAASIIRSAITINPSIKNIKAAYIVFLVSLEQCLALIITSVPALMPLTKSGHPLVRFSRNLFQGLIYKIKDVSSSPKTSKSGALPSFVRMVSEETQQWPHCRIARLPKTEDANFTMNLEAISQVDVEANHKQSYGAETKSVTSLSPETQAFPSSSP